MPQARAVAPGASPATPGTQQTMEETVKIVILAGGSAATVFALAPFATAARNAGHETLMVSTEEMVPYIAGMGIPPVAVTALTPPQYMFTDRSGAPVPPPTGPEDEKLFAGRGFARLAAASLEPLDALVQVWRPDVVVGGALSYAAGIFARRAGLPYVRHAWDPSETTHMDAGAVEELRPELAQLGLDDLPRPDLDIDICPPSLRPEGAPVAHLMRWISVNKQARLEPWMYTRPARRRVVVTSGSRSSDGPVRERDLAFLRGLIDAVEALDGEIVVAAPEGVAADLRAERPELRAGWIPLDVLIHTCDAVVSHGGGVTVMTALSAGVPQLVIPQLSHSLPPAVRMSDFGASITLPPAQATAQAVRTAVGDLLDKPGYRERAGDLAREIASLATPADTVRVVEQLVER